MSTNGFSLKSSSNEFEQRKNSIFDQLLTLENNTKNAHPQHMETDCPRSIPKIKSLTTTKEFRGQESIFKKPYTPTSRNYFTKIPDFKKNPHKWTKYSLDDVRDEDISERSNTSAAMSFLKELENRKAKPVEEDEDDGKIVFKTRSYVQKINKPIDSSEDSVKASFSNTGSTRVMPEYVVGQKKVKNQTNLRVQKKEKKNVELKLNHLLDEEEENY